MDSRQLADTKNIRKESGHTGKSAAIAADNGKHKKLEYKAVRYIRQTIKCKYFKSKENHICHTAADPVRNSRPENTPPTIHDADDSYKGCRFRRCHTDHILCHRRYDGKKTDSASNICKENPPQSVPLPCPHRFLTRKLRAEDSTLLSFLHFRLQYIFKTGNHLSRTGRPKVRCRKRHHRRIDRGKNKEILRQPYRHSKVLHGRARNKSGKSKSHNGQTRSKAVMQRKPLHQRGYRSDIPCSQSDPPDTSVKQVQKHRRLYINGKCRPHHGGGEETGRNQSRLARAKTLHNTAKKSCGKPKK